MKPDRKQKITESGIIPQEIRKLFPEAKETKTDQVLARCVFHDDKNPSLSINTVSGLYNCFACSAAGNFFDLYMKVRAVDFKTALVALEDIAGINHEGGRSDSVKTFPQVVSMFLYHDENGVERYCKKRFEPGFGNSGRKKSFAFYHMKSGKEKKGRGGDPLLYNLHLLAKALPASSVCFVEGEAKADMLCGFDLIATSLDSGAKSAWKPGFTKYFKGHDVYILPDNDPPGEKYAAKIADNLLGVAKSVSILRLPGLPHKGDVLDWVKKNGGKS